MKRKTTIIAMVATFCMASVALFAQPRMTIWSVDAAHLEDHTTGQAEEWPCGYQHYINYVGDYSSRLILIDLLNEGDEPLVLSEAPALSSGSSSDFTLIEPPSNLTIAPGESAHFGILYDAPSTYQSASASLEINSNDPVNGNCTLTFQVGLAVPVPVDVILREGMTPVLPGPDAIPFGSVNVGSTASRTFNLFNSSESQSVAIFPCSEILIPRLPYPIEKPVDIDFRDGPYAIPGPMIPFPPLPIIFDFIFGPDAMAFSTDLGSGGPLIIEPTQSRTFTIDFSPTSTGDKEAAFCYNYLSLTGPPPAAGFNPIFGLSGRGTAEDLPNLPPWALILMSSIVLGLASYLASRRL